METKKIRNVNAETHHTKHIDKRKIVEKILKCIDDDRIEINLQYGVALGS